MIHRDHGSVGRLSLRIPLLLVVVVLVMAFMMILMALMIVCRVSFVFEVRRVLLCMLWLTVARRLSESGCHLNRWGIARIRRRVHLSVE